jgi:hypothetical protein
MEIAMQLPPRKSFRAFLKERGYHVPPLPPPPDNCVSLEAYRRRRCEGRMRGGDQNRA